MESDLSNSFYKSSARNIVRSSMHCLYKEHCAVRTCSRKLKDHVYCIELLQVVENISVTNFVLHFQISELSFYNDAVFVFLYCNLVCIYKPVWPVK
jgi:hypothetical protein